MTHLEQVVSKHFNNHDVTEFESIITVEDTITNNNDQQKRTPLKLTFEDYGNSFKPGDLSIDQTFSVLKKKRPRFAEPLIVEKGENLQCDGMNSIPFQKTVEPRTSTPVLEEVIEELELAEQMDTISVGATVDHENNKLQESSARLDQLSARIYVTSLPENQSLAQKRQDLKQAHERLNQFTCGAKVLVFNCAENSARLETIFQRVQQCVFSLTNFPDLATFALFCQRVYDWLALDEYHVILLHSEGDQSRIRLLLFVMALKSFYESLEHCANKTSTDLQHYLISYPNSLHQAPVGWMRYTSYMRLFSPLNNLQILRSSMQIHRICLHNFPVFEQNKLRLYFKIYTGSPPVHLHTTQIKEYNHSKSSNLTLIFSASTNESVQKNEYTYLPLKGDISIMAYHSRRYPMKRIRLFRLNLHSCQAISDSLRFDHEDFDEISESFPSSMYLILHLTKTGLNCNDDTHEIQFDNVSTKECHMSDNSTQNLLDINHDPENISRLQNSLENISLLDGNRHDIQFKPVGDWMTMKVDKNQCAPSLQTLPPSFPTSVIQSTSTSSPTSMSASASSSTSIKPSPYGNNSNFMIKSNAYHFLDAGLDSKLVEEYDNEFDYNVDDDDDDDGHKQADMEICYQAELKKVKLNQYKNIFHRKLIKFKSKLQNSNKSNESVRCANISTDSSSDNSMKYVTQSTDMDKKSMPPPTGTNIPKRSKISKPNVGKRFFRFISNQMKLNDQNSTTKRLSWNNSLRSTSTGVQTLSGDEDEELSDLSFERLGTSSPIARVFKTPAGLHGIATEQLGPPSKSRKVIISRKSANDSLDSGQEQCLIKAVPTYYPAEDLIEAARRLNIMAGTQELDRLLEELRQTSMNMAAGLPPPSGHHTYKPYYSSQPTRKQIMHDEVYPDHRSISGRSVSATGFLSTPHNFNDNTYSYQKHSSLLSDRMDRSFRSRHTDSLAPTRHQSVFTTTLKQRPPASPKRFNQIHLTIDPNCPPSESAGLSVRLNSQDSFRREQKLEAELMSARQELAQLRRVASLVDQHHQREALSDTRNFTSLRPSYTPRSSGVTTNHYSNHNSTFYRSYQSKEDIARPGLCSSYQGTYNRSQFNRPLHQPPQQPQQHDTLDTGSFSIPKRAISHTNVFTGPRSWNLRSQQGSESNLSYKREMSSSTNLGRSGYSARRERLKQEREQELAMRHARMRQIASSTTGLHDQRHLAQSRQTLNQYQPQQHYRSTSAVNRSMGNSEAFEEFETITLQPIGRGVQDLDSQMGSLTTLARAGGGTSASLIEGLHRLDDSRGASRVGLNQHAFASTQHLHRNTYNQDAQQRCSTNRSQQYLSQTMRSGITNSGASSNIFDQQLNRASERVKQENNMGSSVTITRRPPSQQNHQPHNTKPTTNGEIGPITQNGLDADKSQHRTHDTIDHSNFNMVQATAHIWYRPKLSREEAISILRQQMPGSFLIRDSTTYKDAFGLAVKVATLPPKVTPKSDDLQSELVRHYLIEAVHNPVKGVRLKGFTSEPVFPSLAALINHHIQDALALPCRLILPTIPTTVPVGICDNLPTIVLGKPLGQFIDLPINQQTTLSRHLDNETNSKTDSLIGNGSQLGVGSLTDGIELDGHRSIAELSQIGGGGGGGGGGVGSQHHLPFDCVMIKDEECKRVLSPTTLNHGMTYRCLMLGSVDSPQWNYDVCLTRAVDQLIPLETLTAAECDQGISRVRYSEIQLHVSTHDGITLIDLMRRLFLRRHLPDNVLLYCGIESRRKEFIHPEHHRLGFSNPKIFGLVVRKGISECTSYIFSEFDPANSVESIIKYIYTHYPHMGSK